MKQTITTNQLNELSPKAKEKLREWWKPRFGDKYQTINDFQAEYLVFSYEKCDSGYEQIDNEMCDCDGARDSDDKENCLPLLSIGQMIEFLYDHNTQFCLTSNDTNQVSRTPNGHYTAAFFDQDNPSPTLRENTKNEVVDLFWEPVKQILEN